MKFKALFAALIAMLLVGGAYWYWAPVIVFRQMLSAAKAGDADKFNDHVDYPKLRESFKRQMSTILTEKLATQPGADNEFTRAGKALGNMLGSAMADKLVDMLVRPEVVMRAMQQGKLMPKRSSDGGGPQQPDAKPADEVTWTSERKGMDMYIVFVAKPGDQPGNRVGLVLERSGFAEWKLTEVRLPALK